MANYSTTLTQNKKTMTKYYWAVWVDHQDEEPFVIEELGDSGYFAPEIHHYMAVRLS